MPGDELFVLGKIPGGVCFSMAPWELRGRMARPRPHGSRKHSGCGMLGHALHHEKAMPQHPRPDHDAVRHKPPFRRPDLAPADGVSP